MRPRQTGKTTSAILKYLESPNDTLLVTINHSMVDYLKFDILKLTNNSDLTINLCSEINLLDFLRGKDKFKTIILDEYMFFKNKEDVYYAINNRKPESLIIYSTSDKQYKLSLLHAITYQKLNNIYFDKSNKEYKELYHNFITDSDTEIVDGLSNKSYKHKVMLDNLSYEIEFENKWYINDMISEKVSEDE
jgi:hypothetical protein